MYYVLQRQLAGHYADYVADMETFALTENPAEAAQLSEAGLNMVDIAYLNSIGFYPVACDAFTIVIPTAHIYLPKLRNYRPQGPVRNPRPCEKDINAATQPVHLSRAQRRGHLNGRMTSGGAAQSGHPGARFTGGHGGSHTGGRGGQRGI